MVRTPPLEALRSCVKSTYLQAEAHRELRRVTQSFQPNIGIVVVCAIRAVDSAIMIVSPLSVIIVVVIDIIGLFLAGAFILLADIFAGNSAIVVTYTRIACGTSRMRSMMGWPAKAVFLTTFITAKGKFIRSRSPSGMQRCHTGVRSIQLLGTLSNGDTVLHLTAA